MEIRNQLDDVEEQIIDLKEGKKPRVRFSTEIDARNATSHKKKLTFVIP